MTDPTSFSYQEGMGQVPNFIRLFNFRIYGVDGVPSASLGANGDFALRSTGAAGANTTIYHKEAGAWVGLTA
jgi:hypothetical protein